MDEYMYEELRNAAITSRTPEALAALGEWLQNYGDDCWTGEAWNIGASGRASDDSLQLRPVYGDEPDEFDAFPLLGYDLC